MTGSRRARSLAWALGIVGALGCAFTLGWTVALGLFSPQDLPTSLVFITTGLLGALVASREPGNSVGWAGCAASVAGILFLLPLDYGYTALVVEHGSWPLGGVALWVETWSWTPLLGMFLPLLTVRFPDGRVPPRWRAVDWLAIAGTVAFAISVALLPASALYGFLPLGSAKAVHLLAPLIQNPLATSLPEGLLGLVRYAGLVVIVLGYMTAVASLIARYRGARGDERQQLKWFAYSGVLLAVALVYAAADLILFRPGFGDALLPFDFAAIALPLAIGIAILRYRLYDIDLIINRTLVYAGATAILGALYAAVITFLQRLFISTSGQKSDSAYVLTAFVVVVAFSPVKDWLQRRVDRRLSGVSATALLDRFREDVDAVVSVIDVHRVACRFVDEAVAAFDARGADLYLKPASNPVYSHGQVNGAAIEVQLAHEGRQLGRLVLGGRRGGVNYSTHDRDALQRSADSVGEALALAEHLGHRPLLNFHDEKEE